MPSRSALEVAVEALARRDRSAAELAAYLARRGARPEDAAAALDRLAEAGYLDDARFAASRAEALARRGYGDEAIRADLERRSLDRELVEEALAGLEPEAERALALAGRLGAGAATARRLTAKGFSPDAVASALARDAG
ncbi:MAG TPA: RecX family transcriptional regulator [Gaiellaceae bacterium]|nr:RecX family transcriptional regulator [Gaiellaceae bacterium]